MFIYLLVTVFLPVASFHAIIQEPIIAGVVEFLGIPLMLLTCDYGDWYYIYTTNNHNGDYHHRAT